MTDRLLTEQEIREAMGGDTLWRKCRIQPHHTRIAIAAEKKAVAACNQEWQEKINAKRDLMRTRYLSHEVNVGYCGGYLQLAKELLEAI